MPYEAQKPDPGKIKLDKQSLARITLHDAQLLATAKAYVEADVSVSPGTFDFKVLEVISNFARVGVSAGAGGGYYLLLKKVHDIWVVLLAGQDKPDKAFGEKYGLPEGWYTSD